MRSAHPVLTAKQSTPYPYTASNDYVAVATLAVSSGAYITPLLEYPLQASTSNRAMADIHAPFFIHGTVLRPQHTTPSSKTRITYGIGTRVYR